MRYFPSLSFRSLVYSFRGRNVLRGEDFVTPRPGRVYSTTTVGAYTNTKCHIVIFWRCNDNLVNLECCNRIRVQLSFSKKG